MRVRRYIPFSYKMMLPYLLLILLTDIVIGYFSYTTASQSKIELIESNSRWTLQQMEAAILYKMEDLQDVSDSLVSSPAFQDYLQIQGDHYDIYATTSKSLVPLLDTALRMTSQDLRLIVYTKNPNIDEIYTHIDGVIAGQTHHVLSYSRIVNAAWHQQMKRAGEDHVWRHVDDDLASENISLIRKLISFNDFQTEIGILRLTVPLRKLFLMDETMHTVTENVVPVVPSASDAAVADNGPSHFIRVLQKYHRESPRLLLQNVETPSPLQEADYLSIRQPIGDTDFILEMLVPKQTLYQDSKQIAMITLLICIASFLVVAGIAVIIAKYSGRKMMRIVTHVRSFQHGDLAKRIPHSGRDHDEFSQISTAFNVMAQRIEELIQEVYEQGMQKKEMELQALQAQINPHFLYNTLSSINSLANIGNIASLSSMVSELTRFYRLTLSDGKMVIPLADEIDQVKAYLKIQGIKYNQRFIVKYDIDPSCGQSSTLKLILQPFVENIFKHAWFDERIHIRITARRDGDNVILKVIDNGVGIPPHLLAAIQNDDHRPSEGGYGIRNVRERIKLHYGPAGDVEIRSGYGIGTSVKITIPYNLSTI